MKINEVHFSAAHKTAAQALQQAADNDVKVGDLRLYRRARPISSLFIDVTPKRGFRATDLA